MFRSPLLRSLCSCLGVVPVSVRDAAGVVSKIFDLLLAEQQRLSRRPVGALVAVDGYLELIADCIDHVAFMTVVCESVFHLARYDLPRANRRCNPVDRI